MQQTNIKFQSLPTHDLQGEMTIPGDKSISHRALMLSAIAEGESTIQGLLMGEDNLATLLALRQLGVTIHQRDERDFSVQGVGLHGLSAPCQALNLGNAGTGMRLLTGLLAGQKFNTELFGDESLSCRPMGRIVKPLELMGAKILASANGTPPLNIIGNQALHGIEYAMPIASAQVKSCILLAGLYAAGRTTVIEPGSSRDHTERLLQAFGYEVEINGHQISLVGGGKLTAQQIIVPSDISSAAFFMVAASIVPGSDILLKNVGINPTRVGVINILQKMGADITIHNEHFQGNEPVADIRVKFAKLTGIEIPRSQVPLAIDEFPVLFIAAACASGETSLRHAKELRVKETDRIAAMADGLHKVGIETTVLDDGIIIQGGQINGGEVDSFGDHRIAMAFAVAGSVAKAPIVIHDCRNVATSFPEFIACATKIGMKVIKD